jgi:hypothetical protein
MRWPPKVAAYFQDLCALTDWYSCCVVRLPKLPAFSGVACGGRLCLMDVVGMQSMPAYV